MSKQSSVPYFSLELQAWSTNTEVFSIIMPL